MDFLELLRLRGLELDRQIKFLRHMGDSGIVQRALAQGLLGEYQRYQKRAFFKDCEFVISFVGEEAAAARFLGVFRVDGVKPVTAMPSTLLGIGVVVEDLAECIELGLVEVPGFEDLVDRVVIDWGRGALAWHQWATSKEVLEIRRRGAFRPFPGFLDFVLEYEDLRRIVSHPEANPDWRTMLSGVAGVYLIVDATTGAQYVGSACGAEGIWGRWSEYARSGHGNNARLRDLAEDNPGHFRNFRFSVLRTLPKTLTKQEVCQVETLYKEKLGSRAFGLNDN